MKEYTACELDEIRHRSRVDEAVRKTIWKGQSIDDMPKKERVRVENKKPSQITEQGQASPGLSQGQA